MRLLTFKPKNSSGVSSDARIGVRLERQVLDLAKAVSAGEAPLPKEQASLRGGAADAAILWCCDGSHKRDKIASLRSQ